MSNKFLDASGTDISDGSALVYAASLGASSLDPSQPVKTNSTRQLVSTKLDISDINSLQTTLDSVITNPFAGELTAQSYVATLGNPNKRMRITEDTITSDNGTVMDFMTTDTIDLQATNVLVNGANIATSTDLSAIQNQSAIVNKTDFVGTLEAPTVKTAIIRAAANDAVYIRTELTDITVKGDYIELDGNISANTNRIASVGEPLDAQDAATKSYVDTKNLQDAYDGSSEIVTTTANGPVSIENGTASDANIALEIKRSSGQTSFSVNGDGTVTTNNKVNTPQIINTGGSGLLSVFGSELRLEALNGKTTLKSSNTNNVEITSGNDMVLISPNVIQIQAASVLQTTGNIIQQIATGSSSTQSAVTHTINAPIVNVNQLSITSSVIEPSTNGAIDLGSSGKYFLNLFVNNIERPVPIASSSQITNFNDYSSLTPGQMLSSITVGAGGTNRCYGNAVRMIADVDLLAGRVVSLADYGDTSTNLRVSYIQTGSEISPVAYPVGITLGNALAGETIDVCTQGLCTAITSGGVTLQRGSIVACTGNTGLVETGSLIAENVGVLGSVAMGGVVIANAPILIYLQPWYSVY